MPVNIMKRMTADANRSAYASQYGSLFRISGAEYSRVPRNSLLQLGSSTPESVQEKPKSAILS